MVSRAPRASAELPEIGERFEGLLPPVVAAPAFAIRRPTVSIFSLDDYMAAGIMTAADQAETLRQAVAERATRLGKVGRRWVVPRILSEGLGTEIAAHALT
jgi:type IV secretion system protein TrbB